MTAKGMHPNSLAQLHNGRKSPLRARRLSYAKLGEMTARMMAGRFTVRQLRTACGISTTSATNWIRALHDAGCIHIVEYARTRRNGHGAAVFTWGHGDDAPLPAGVSAAERARRSRQRRQTLDGAWKGVQA